MKSLTSFQTRSCQKTPNKKERSPETPVGGRLFHPEQVCLTLLRDARPHNLGGRLLKEATKTPSGRSTFGPAPSSDKTLVTVSKVHKNL